MKATAKMESNLTAHSGETVLSPVNLEACGHFPFRGTVDNPIDIVI